MHPTDTLLATSTRAIARAAAEGQGSGASDRRVHRIEAGASTEARRLEPCALAEALDAMWQDEPVGHGPRPLVFRAGGEIERV